MAIITGIVTDVAKKSGVVSRAAKLGLLVRELDSLWSLGGIIFTLYCDRHRNSYRTLFIG
jgi:hypothetical protein